MTNDRLVIGIDLSTQSCTVEARRVEDFEVVARQRLPLLILICRLFVRLVSAVSVMVLFRWMGTTM